MNPCELSKLPEMTEEPEPEIEEEFLEFPEIASELLLITVLLLVKLLAANDPVLFIIPLFSIVEVTLTEPELEKSESANMLIIL